MKFRYKVLAINLILLSLSLGMVGYLMIRRNFELARDGQIQNAVVENNLLQYSVEYELLQVLNNSGYVIKDELKSIGARVSDGINATESSFYIKYGDDFVFASNDEEYKISEELFQGLTEGKKNYIIINENGKYYTCITSNSTVDDVALCVISKYDISRSYELMESQIGYFRILIIVVLVVAALVMYFISMYLTRPLEILNRVTDEIAKGKYDTRVGVKTQDEIGHLSEKFNYMAESVENHIDELNDMIHRREQFVADFTHEIKTPMTTIIGYADTLRSREITREDQIRALSYIFSEGRRLEKMSAELFELIYLKHNEIEKTNINMENFGNNIKEIVVPILEQKDITLNTMFEPAVISGNQELLISVFVNIIDNARKASDKGASISFIGRTILSESEMQGCECAEGEALGRELTRGEFEEYKLSESESWENQQNTVWKYVFEVTDNGIGMSEEDVKSICDEFYMADKSRSRKEGGAGLGMSIVKMILDKHNAKMEIESKLYEGTKIRIYLP